MNSSLGKTFNITCTTRLNPMPIEHHASNPEYSLPYWQFVYENDDTKIEMGQRIGGFHAFEKVSLFGINVLFLYL